MVFREEDVSMTPVSLHYLFNLDSTFLDGKLAETTTLYQTKAKIEGPENLYVEKGTTIEQVKRFSLFGSGRGKVRGSKKEIALSKKKLELKKRSHWDVSDVLEYVVKPAVAEKGSCMAFNLDSRHLGNADTEYYYISTPHEIWWTGMVKALRTYFANEDPRDVYIWFDVINVDQIKIEKDLQFKKDVENSIQERIRGAKGHLVYFDGWGSESNRAHRKKVTALHDPRTLYEIYCSKVENVKLSVVMRPPTLREFNQSLREDGLQYFEREVKKVFFKDQDEKRLVTMDSLFEKHEGKDKILSHIQAHLEGWFVNEFSKQVPALASKKDIDFAKMSKDINRVAVVHSRVGNLEMATTLFKQVVEFQERGQGAYSPAVAFSKNNLALILQKQHKLDEAIPLLEEAIDILQEVEDGSKERQVFVIIRNLANILETKGDKNSWYAAEKKRQILVEMAKGIYGERSKQAANALRLLGLVRIKLDNVERAKEDLLASLAILEEQPENDEQRLKETIDSLALVYELERNHDDPDPQHQVEIARTLMSLAQVYRKKQEDHHASHYGDRALGILSSVLGKEHPETQKFQDEILSLEDQD